MATWVSRRRAAVILGQERVGISVAHRRVNDYHGTESPYWAQEQVVTVDSARRQSVAVWCGLCSREIRVMVRGSENRRREFARRQAEWVFPAAASGRRRIAYGARLTAWLWLSACVVGIALLAGASASLVAGLAVAAALMGGTLIPMDSLYEPVSPGRPDIADLPNDPPHCQIRARYL
nr:hypothetical protein OH820_03875 [Streptomyces sp. NBC_00857]